MHLSRLLYGPCCEFKRPSSKVRKVYLKHGALLCPLKLNYLNLVKLALLIACCTLILKDSLQ